ncbi:phosphatase 2C-like domain-containing protein [Spinellus fusiger]|nr:phosphatase 2C-like domain-containing protein [Spinellus fusiger]
MARHYAQRLATVSQMPKSLSYGSIVSHTHYLRPALSTYRLSAQCTALQQRTFYHKDGLESIPYLSRYAAIGQKTTTKSPIKNRGIATKSEQEATWTANLTATAELHLKEESEPSIDRFRFFASAFWHAKNRNTKSRSSESRIPYWKQKEVGKVDAGEDAFFYTCTPKGMALGVADGVGGWADVGVDPALFSWTLMNNAAGVAKEENPVDAHHILDTAFHQLRIEGDVPAGSSTACILNICKSTGKMTTCNVGDSAFLLIRDKKVVYESPSQQHYFNCPYQLTVVPDTYPDRENYVTDMPKDGDRKSFFLKDNDVIVLATDGDTTEEDEVAAIVRVLVKTLTDNARRLSLDPKRLSPWAQAAQAHGSHYRGGKVDDITCIVALVKGIHPVSRTEN